MAWQGGTTPVKRFLNFLVWVFVIVVLLWTFGSVSYPGPYGG
jgi:hypothetical protein